MDKAQGQNTLGIIFGFFILLIVTLVILGLFFKTAEKGESGMEGATTEYFTKQNIQKAVSECKSLCDSITGIDSAIEFCKKVQKIDFNGNGVITGDTAERGRYSFCESQIPCFVLTDCTDKGYGPDTELGETSRVFSKCGETLDQNEIEKEEPCAEANWKFS